MTDKQRKNFIKRFIRNDKSNKLGYVNHEQGIFWASDGTMLAWFHAEDKDGLYNKHFKYIKDFGAIPGPVDVLNRVYNSMKNKSRLIGNVSQTEIKKLIKVFKLARHGCVTCKDDDTLRCDVCIENGELTATTRNGVVHIETVLDDFNTVRFNLTRLLKILKTHTSKETKIFISNDAIIMEGDNWNTILMRLDNDCPL